MRLICVETEVIKTFKITCPECGEPVFKQISSKDVEKAEATYCLNHHQIEFTPEEKTYIKTGHRECEDTRDLIVETALANPWLSTHEISEEVGTSDGYVRTVLSNYHISLKQLRRKEFAKVKEENKELRRKLE